MPYNWRQWLERSRRSWRPSVFFVETGPLSGLSVPRDWPSTWSENFESSFSEHKQFWRPAFQNSGDRYPQLIERILSLPLNRPSLLLWSTSNMKNVEGVRNLLNWSPDMCSLCCTAIECCGISAVNKEFMVDGLLANIGIGVVLPFRSYPLATGSLVTYLHTCSTWSRRVKNSLMRCLWWFERGRWIAKNVSCVPDKFHVSNGKRLCAA